LILLRCRKAMEKKRNTATSSGKPMLLPSGKGIDPDSALQRKARKGEPWNRELETSISLFCPRAKQLKTRLPLWHRRPALSPLCSAKRLTCPSPFCQKAKHLAFRGFADAKPLTALSRLSLWESH
jgi:hypothetical protein